MHASGRVARPRVEVGRRAPHGGRIVRCTARAGGRLAGGRRCGRMIELGRPAAERAIDLAPVRRTAVGAFDLRVPGDYAGPLLGPRPIDRRFVRECVEQRRRGPDVGEGVAPRRLQRHARARCAFARARFRATPSRRMRARVRRTPPLPGPFPTASPPTRSP